MNGLKHKPEYRTSLELVKMDVFKFKIDIIVNIWGLEWYLELLSMSPMISGLFCHIKMLFSEINYVAERMINLETYDTSSYFYFSPDQLQLLNDNISTLKTLTFEAELRILDVYSHGMMATYDYEEDAANEKKCPEKSIRNDYQKYQQQSEYSSISATNEFIWDIAAELMLQPGCKSAIFRMFGLEWQLYLDDDEDNKDFFYVRLRLMEMPENVYVLKLHHESFWEDKQFTASNYIKIIKRKLHKSCWFYHYEQDAIRRDQLQDLEKITFKIKLSLFDVYDVNGFCITDKFVNSDGCSEIIQRWLENNLNLGKYYQLFIEFGLRNMEDVLSLSMEKLDKMGIENIDDKIRILHQIDKDKQTLME